MQLMLMVVGGATLLILGGLLWMHVQQQAATERLDDRMAHLSAGVSLLTDTAEGALRDVAAEISRLAALTDANKVRPRAMTQRRIAASARRGRTVQDIAATEQISEGEVRLRLQLESARKERAHASVR
jgi:hypothetical protein